jgi:tryptophan halogenase
LSAEPHPLADIIVVGRDTDLWLAALALGRALRRSGPRLTVVELPSSLPKGAVVACLPQLTAFHDKLGIAEGQFVRATGASYTHGQAFVGRGLEWHSFFHAWASFQWPVSALPFFPCWLKAQAAGLTTARLEEYCLPAVAARHGRVVVATEDQHGPSHAGLHVEAASYAAYLKAATDALGIPIVQASSVAVESGSGGIAAVLIDGARARIEGQLFVDATGAEAALMGRLAAADSLVEGAASSVDRVLTGRAPRFNRIPPLSEVRVGPSGWTALHPTQALTAVTHVFASATTSDEQARRIAASSADVSLQDVEIRGFRSGIRPQPWHQNCVAVGAAACVLDPLHDVAAFVLQLGIVHLLSLLPDIRSAEAERAEYNRIMWSSLARIRDFQQAFYRLAPAAGAFWEAARERRPTPELEFKLAAFEARGLFAPMEDESFSAESWQAVLTGFGVRPSSLPPVVGGAALEPIAAELAQQRRATRDAARRMPAHEEYLRSGVPARTTR